jgi:hypothetical protein
MATSTRMVNTLILDPIFGKCYEIFCRRDQIYKAGLDTNSVVKNPKYFKGSLLALGFPSLNDAKPSAAIMKLAGS